MTVDAVNARGSSTDARLQDVLVRVREIALHGVRHGAAVALTAAQVQTGYELHTMETGFPMGDGPEEHEDLLEEFTIAAEAIVDITSAQDVVNKVFDSFVLRVILMNKDSCSSMNMFQCSVLVYDSFCFGFCSVGDTYRIGFYCL